LKNDPHADREAARYAHPIASRKYITHQITEAGVPLSFKRICKLVGIETPTERTALQNRLSAMVRDGQLVADRKDLYGLVSKMDLITGKVTGHRDGYGFLLPEDGSSDLYLDSRQMRTIFHGDRVVARLRGSNLRGRSEGEVVEVLEHNTHSLVGRFYKSQQIAMVEPMNRKLNHDVLIEPDGEAGAIQGQIVVVEITSQPSKHNKPTGIVTEVLGDHLEVGMEVEIAVRSHDLPFEWPDEVLEQVDRMADRVSASDKRNRRDLRELQFVTIDGEDAKDFDDAVYCEKKSSGGWRLYVAIADVSHYVLPGSTLDLEAFKRGTSVYFPRTVIPMLPEKLSNGLCSLRPDVDRLALVCEMTITARGKISGYQFYEGVIRSKAGLTYTLVGQVLEEGKKGKKRSAGNKLRGQRQQLVPDLDELYALYGVLKKRRADRGALDFDSVETKLLFNEQGKVESIEPIERNDAHKLIEESMLCANVCASRVLTKHKLAGLYRIHEGPSAEKLSNLQEFLAQFGMKLSGDELPQPSDYQALLAAAKGRNNAHVIQTALLRSLSQAVYQPSNKGHFGLNYDEYAHFTSPIRRYPDLLVHRSIRAVIGSSVKSAHVQRFKSYPTGFSKLYPYEMEEMVMFGDHCSMTERRADEAVYDVIGWLKCEYIEDRVGDVFDGVISGVTGFGLFVELADVYVEGLVHVSTLSTDYYHFEPGRQCLTGERSGQTYRIGEPVKVQVVKVNLDERKIDCELVSHSGSKSRRKAKGGKGRERTGRRKAGRRRR
jgi:ribonuclease R